MLFQSHLLLLTAPTPPSGHASSAVDGGPQGQPPSGQRPREARPKLCPTACVPAGRSHRYPVFGRLGVVTGPQSWKTAARRTRAGGGAARPRDRSVAGPSLAICAAIRLCGTCRSITEAPTSCEMPKDGALVRRGPRKPLQSVAKRRQKESLWPGIEPGSGPPKRWTCRNDKVPS